MKIFAGHLYIFAFIGMMAIASCKNNSTAPTARKLLVGKWNIVKITTEENYNEVAGAIDDNHVVIAFNADGTGSSSSVSGGSAFKWSLAENDTYLDITDSATSQVVALLLTKTSTNSFTVKDTSTHPAQFEIFKKQNDK